MNKVILAAAPIFLLIFVLKLSAQEVVISEYKNTSPTPNGEWIEMIVIDDNISMNGYYLIDNKASSGAPDEWQGGLKFTDHDLWKNLREGTIIVINSRSSIQADVDKSDGYIEVGAHDTDLFEKYCINCDLSEWDFKALSIAQTADLIQIRDASGSHVHCLGHILNNAGDFASLPGKKISYSGSIDAGESVFVIPGGDLTHFEKGFDSGGNWTAKSSSNTKGFPNDKNAAGTDNSDYWRTLRQPEWDDPQITKAGISETRVNLVWNTYESPMTYQGYLVMRFLTSQLAGVRHPVDGEIYFKGDNLGTAEVIYVGPNISYNDNYELECDSSYTYRVYGFRFDADNNNQDNDPKNGRGRSYNETNYASIIAKKLGPPKDLEIKAADDDVVICEDESVELRAEFTGNPDNFEYRWNRNGILVADFNEGKSTLMVSQGGEYEIIMRTGFGCERRDTITIEEVDNPDVDIFRQDETEITRDTTYRICDGESVLLKTTGGDNRQWYLDGNPIPGETTFEYTASQEGSYRVLADNRGKCVDSSYMVIIDIIDVDFTVDASKTFSVSSTESFVDEDIIIQNNADEDLAFNAGDITFNPAGDYQIINPANPPYVVPANGQLPMTIRFTPSQPGETKVTMALDAPCDNTEESELFGIKEAAAKPLTSQYLNYNLGTKISCRNITLDTTIILTNEGTSDVDLMDAIIAQPFQITYPGGFPKTVNQSDTIHVDVSFDSNTEGIYNEQLEVYYDDGINMDTVTISVRCEVITPKYELQQDRVEFVLGDCDDYIDTTIKVFNRGKASISLREETSHPAMQIISLPPTIQPADSGALTLRFQPAANDLDKDLSVTFAEDSCDIQKQFEFRGTKNGYLFSLSETQIGPDTLVSCDGAPVEKIYNIDLEITGDSDSIPKIENFDFTGSIQSQLAFNNISPGEILSKGTNPIEIKFTGAPDKEYSGTVELALAPCSRKKTIDITVAVYQPKAAISETNIDFGAINVSQTATGSFDITNDGKLPVTVNQISEINPPFYIDDNQTVARPFDLAPAQSETIYLEYNPMQEGTDNLTISADILSKSCDLSGDVALTGEAGSPGQDQVSAWMITKAAAPGDFVELPIRIVPVNDFDMSASDITSIGGKITYDENLFYPEKITGGEGVPQTAIANSTVNIVQPGEVVFEVEISDPVRITEGNAFNLGGTALLGDTLASDIILDSLSITAGSSIEVKDKYNGRLLVDGKCLLNERTVEMSDGTYLLLNSSNPVVGDVELVFKTIVDDPTSLKIYNTIGRKVATLYNKNDHKAGVYTAGIVSGTLSGGLYFAVLRSGNIVRTLKIVVTN